MNRATISFSAYLDSLSNFGIEPSLEGIEILCATLGHPEKSFEAVQITGTNGKTSVARMTGAILEAHDVPTGVYISPHLEDYRERMIIGGREIGPKDFAALGLTVRQAVDAAERRLGDRRITQFEALTGAALRAFADFKVRAAVLEVGMGGRWDATSIVRPAVSVVTNVTLDHADWLGPERKDIAAEKAYVIKEGTIGIIGRTSPDIAEIFRRRTREVGKELLQAGADFSYRRVDRGFEVATRRRTYSGIEPGAPGQWQAENVALAVVAAEEFLKRPLKEGPLRNAVAQTRCPGRAELFPGNPDVLLDGAHNAAGAGELSEYIRTDFAGRSKVVLVAILKDKNVPRILAELKQIGPLVFTEAENPRRLPAAQLKKAAAHLGVSGEARADMFAALSRAKELAGPDGLVIVTGSLYLVGPMRAFLTGKTKK